MKYLKHFLCLCAVFVSFVFGSVEIHAEESEKVSTSITYSFHSVEGSTYDYIDTTTVEMEGTNVSYVAYYYDESYPNQKYLYLEAYPTDTSLSSSVWWKKTMSTVGLYNGKETNSGRTEGDLTISSATTANVLGYSYKWLGAIPVGNVYDIGDTITESELDISVPLFATRTDAIEYIVNGSTDGMLNKDPWEYSKDKHNFKADTIDTTIPLPVISNVSHKGFTVDNIEGTEYFVDLLVENRLYGVKHYEKPNVSDTVDMDVFSNSWDCIPDTSWEYATDYFNVCASTDVAINHSVINLEDDYSLDNVSSLLSHFAQWSIDYPKRKNLPDYKWTMMSSLADSLYESKHTLQAVSDISSEQQLYNSGQASTSYYVRFYTKDNRTGQWVRYTYRDGYGTIYNGMIEDGTISSGVVDISPDGNVIVKDEVNGNVSEDGSIYYPVNDNTTATNFDSSLNGFMETLSGFSGVLGMFGGFMTSMFGWLPWWCSALIGAALVAVVVLRFLGR